MAQSKLELILEMKDRLTTSLKRAKDAVSQSSEDMKRKMQSLKTSFVGALAEMRQEIPLLDKALRLMSNPIVLLTTAIGAVGAGVSRLKQFAAESIETYRVQAEAETKLGQVMRNTMGARQAEIDSIKQLASEQQALGVIGDEIQLAGAQELGTYLTKAKNLRTLLPVLNDMVAQQYGYNATQESAVNIATMMGKVMDGQVGALSRYGYKFDEAQEHILKFGTEEQRAATLADVVRESVGGVNAALANTPEGRLKQYENNLGDLHERAGAFFNYLKAAFLPVGQALMDGWQKVMSVFERNRERITQIVNSLATHIGNVIRGVFTMAGYIKNAVSFLYEWRAAIYGAAAAYAVLHARQIAAVAVLAAQKTATALVTAAQWLLNIAMSANPIGIIIVAIGALISRFEGWVTVWNAVKATLTASIGQYVATVKLYYQEIWSAMRIFWEYLKAFGIFVGNIASKIWNSVKSAVQPVIDLFNTVKGAIQSLWGKTAEVGQQVEQTVTQTTETVKTTFRDMVESVRGFFVRLWQGVVGIWQRVTGFVGRIGGVFAQVAGVIRTKFQDIVAPVVAVFDRITAKFQSFVDKVKDLVQRVGSLLTNTGDAIKSFLSGKWDEAKQLFKQGLDTDAVVTLKAERDQNRQTYKDESLERARDVVGAWRDVDLHRKSSSASESTATDAAETDYNTGSIGAGGDGDASASQTIAGSAKQIRNITVNIEAFNKGGINTTNTEGLQGMSATDIEDWFNQMLLRTIRNIELSY